ncbi:MAG: Rieske 2Fe-2S domain-containing protein [Gammaproteobacteria bacterium]|nr:Rieske 2Fe-2S domain-containing protein [Gammaproteobacteria bacterium]
MGRTQTENTTEPIRALDPRFYTDPEVFTQEKERIFFRTWQYACHEGEIENPGDFVVFDIADQSLFVMRDANSVLRCFYNVCQHRAHELLQGKGNRKLIICPYHAWTYHLNGRLKAARNTTAVRDFDASKICLSEIKVEVFCGFVFVNLDSDAAPMNDWYPNAAQDLASYVPDIDRYRLLWAHNADEHCNWKVAVENYNECYHCRVVHPSFTKGVIAPQSVDIVPQGYTLRHSAQGVVSDKASYSFDDTTYRVIYLWPTMSIQIYPGRVVNTYWWRPKSLTDPSVSRLAHT